MIRVKVSTADPMVPHIKMTPDSKGILGNFQFFIDQDIPEVDWWVVVDGLSKKEKAICPKENTILITQETEVVKTYNQKYINQFNWIITSQQTLKHPRQIFTQQGHQSYLFLQRIKPGQSLDDYRKQFKTFDELRAMTEIPKSKILSTVISQKLRTNGAKARRDFVMKLKEHFGDKFDIYSNKLEDNRLNVFGPNAKSTPRKWDAVSPYKYVLSIENSYAPHWWTNHLFDAFLAGAYPIFYGHPNIYDYFPKDSLTLIDIDDVAGSIATIEKVISGNYYEKNLKSVWEARKLVLEKYYLFAMLADVIGKLPSSNNKPRLITLEPEKKPWLKKKIVEILKGKGALYMIPRKIYRTYRRLHYGEIKYSPLGQSPRVMNELVDSSNREAEPRGIQPIVHLRSDAVYPPRRIHALLARRNKMLTNTQIEARNKIVNKMRTGEYPLRENTCLCGEKRDILIAKKDRYNIPIQTMLCTACGLMRSDPYYDEKALSEFYKNDYRQLYTGNKQATENFFTEQKGFGKYIYDFLEKNVFKKEITGKKIFEIGCGAGGILETFRGHHNEVFGCDYGEIYIEFGKQKGLKLVTGGADTLRPFGKADLIILNHVLEHMTEPQKELAKIRELLSPSGTLYVALPGIYSIHKTYRGNLMGYLQNAHIWYFTLKTLNSLLAKSGFQLVAGDEIIMAAYKTSDLKQASDVENPEKILGYLKKIKNLRWYYSLKQFSLRHTAFETLRKFPLLYRVTRFAYRKVKNHNDK